MKKLIPIAIVLAVLAVVAGGIYWFGRDTKVPTEEITLPKIIENEQALVAEINNLRQQMNLTQNYLFFENPEKVAQFNELIKQNGNK